MNYPSPADGVLSRGGDCRMAYSLSVHDCQAVRIERFMPANSNCLSLVIACAEGEFSINLFDLPDSAVAMLVAALGKPEHIDATPPLELLSNAAQANIVAALEQATQPFMAAAKALKSVTAADEPAQQGK